MKGLHARKRIEHWSGHGEGGTLVSVEIVGWERNDIYNSTARDHAICDRIIQYVNVALAAADGNSNAEAERKQLTAENIRKIILEELIAHNLVNGDD